jgi:hypothetical protein
MESTVPASEKFVRGAPPEETPPGFLAQIRPYLHYARVGLDVAPKIMAVLLSSSLFCGGLIFLLYFWSVGFMPEMDVQASLTLLVAAAITGAFVLVYIVLLVLLPGLCLGFSLQGEKSRLKRVSWFALPLLVFLVVVFLLFETNSWKIYSAAAVASLALVLAFLLRLSITKSLSVAFAYLLGVFLATGSLFVIYAIADQVLRGRPEWAILPHHQEWSIYIITAIIFLMNASFVANSPSDWRWSVSLVCFLGLSVIILWPTLIPNGVMGVYKFGHFVAASLALDEKGCAIAQDYGLPARPPRCHLAEVLIHSRLGSTYYVEVRRDDGTSVCFTLPAKEVLSWSVADKQWTDASWPKGCYLKK